ncbi:MAG: hypothetical protein M1840_005483 [Geoglossum simile]|nr:MAG: hypothetical protein M1840_005483 [Geoglossum simile]
MDPLCPAHPQRQTRTSTSFTESSPCSSTPRPSSPPLSPASSPPLLARPSTSLTQRSCPIHPAAWAKPGSPPPQVQIASDKRSRIPGTAHSYFKYKESSSSPIPIPKPAGSSNLPASTPSTPLSARENLGAYFPRHDVTSNSTSNTQLNSLASPPFRRKGKADRPSTGPSSSSTPHLSPKMNSTVMSSASQIKARKNGALKLASLPRFHPANYQSQNTGSGFTPVAVPGGTPRHYSDAQLQLHQYQRELIANATRGKTSSSCARPVSPRLLPLGSPGPVTPLVLEEEGGYLVAGASNQNSVLGESGQKDLVERLIREESLRHGDVQSERAAHTGGRR